jgi:two-component system, NtrC family, sensor histidine kinase KinB
MKAYRVSVTLKLGLVVFAVLIAVASLAYTQRLVQRLGEREQFIIQLWAAAQERVAETSLHVNPYLPELTGLSQLLNDPEIELAESDRRRMREALDWARGMPPAGDLTLASEILLQGHFGVPAVIVDSALGRPVAWHNVGIAPTLEMLAPEDSARVIRRLTARVEEMGRIHQPISIDIRSPDAPGAELRQYVYYDESNLIKELRIYPYLQLIIVGLFVLVGYLGFSYVRRSEQRSLWVGMAKEAAHQLGTPISSLMGWTELLKSGALATPQQGEALEEMDEDIRRLQRVASRFSDIGSLPRLSIEEVGPIVQNIAEYMRKRLPTHARSIRLETQVEPGLKAPVNEELFEWVIENLLKNALDAIEDEEGQITVRVESRNAEVVIDVEDTGKGIERRDFGIVFRPGYSTKKRGWGLGLSLAKRIVEDYHKGRLTIAQSRVGEGTTFRVQIPAASQDDRYTRS